MIYEIWFQYDPQDGQYYARVIVSAESEAKALEAAREKGMHPKETHLVNTLNLWPHPSFPMFLPFHPDRGANDLMRSTAVKMGVTLTKYGLLSNELYKLLAAQKEFERLFGVSVFASKDEQLEVTATLINAAYTIF